MFLTRSFTILILFTMMHLSFCFRQQLKKPMISSKLLMSTKSHGAPYQLVLVRHGESTWNQENKFTGWYDCPLSEKGHKEAENAGKLLKSNGFEFDLAYTSTLKRAIRTLWHSLEQTDFMYIPIVHAWELNERHYGALQGLDKKATVEKYGSEQVNIWRRSYDIPPPPVELDSIHYPGIFEDILLIFFLKLCSRK